MVLVNPFNIANIVLSYMEEACSGTGWWLVVTLFATSPYCL